MDKVQIYNFLKEKGIWYKTIEHEPVFTVEQAEALNLPDPETGAKNLFLRDDKKRNYYLITVQMCQVAFVIFLMDIGVVINNE